MRINVTKSFLPPKDDYLRLVDRIWETGHLTNQGPCVTELEQKLTKYLDVPFLQFCSNGTIALQLALRVLDITQGDIITTPFSYVATTSSILWERCHPVFVDIDPATYCIDVSKIEAAITPATRAIMAVHVFGYPCDVEGIERIAKKHNLKVIYDAAHAFGTRYKGRSLLSYGDVATCSFHATKLFHTVEGGAVVVHDEVAHKKLSKLKSFGHMGDDHFCLGINGKNSEFHAAMGLANLPHITEIMADRKRVADIYTRELGGIIGRPQVPAGLEYNYAYYPALFQSEQHLINVVAALNAADIFPRRYFYPSLNTLPYLNEKTSCPVSEDIASRIACLPLFVGLADENVRRITDIIKSTKV